MCALSWHVGAAAVPLQGAAVRGSWLAGAPAGCRCRVLLQGAAVRMVCALWSWPAGAAAG